ncbi:MAG TPA: hypothetical protein VF546_03505 [Pyrinomonadaceae bacterium]|jgi:hypothetical protein
MVTSLDQSVPTLSELPVTLPREGAIEIELKGGIVIFRISQIGQRRIEALLDKQSASGLTPAEEQELSQYEDVDDYLSYLNRLTRNLAYHVESSQRELARPKPEPTVTTSEDEASS